MKATIISISLIATLVLCGYAIICTTPHTTITQVSIAKVVVATVVTDNTPKVIEMTEEEKDTEYKAFCEKTKRVMNEIVKSESHLEHHCLTLKDINTYYAPPWRGAPSQSFGLREMSHDGLVRALRDIGIIYSSDY